MYLVRFLLPLYDAAGERYPARRFRDVRAELTAWFGGVRAWVQSPARGLWQEEDGRVARDDVALHEVWWKPWTVTGGPPIGRGCAGAFSRMSWWCGPWPSSGSDTCARAGA